MSNKYGHTKDDETAFEDHFCLELEVKGKYRVHKDSEISIDKDLCLYFNDLEEFLQSTQQENLLKLKGELGPKWKNEFRKHFRAELQKKKLFQILKDGISINDIHLDLVYFPPSRETNK